MATPTEIENGARNDNADPDRRGFLKCMSWAGTAMIWTITGGIPRSHLVGQADAAEKGFSFAQISDSHLGFRHPVNTNVIATFQDGLNAVVATPEKPAFLIHTGDITHFSKPDQFDTAAQMLAATKLTVHAVPGEHDVVEDNGKSFLNHYGRGTLGDGWYSFNAHGVHFIGLVNVVALDDTGLGSLGQEQLTWLEKDVKGLSTSTPIVVFAHMPLWVISKDWGWGSTDGGQALTLLKRFGSVTVLNGHIHQVMQKIEGHVTFHTARSTAFPQGVPGVAKGPGPMTVPSDKLQTYLGTARISLVTSHAPLAVVDIPLLG